ncbi:MAG: zincin-like metallopeptidase domain-containing protein [Candidatus Binataceae bacterium]
MYHSLAGSATPAASETGAAFLCAEAGISNAVIENQAAYVAGWLTKLRDDRKLLIHAASQAQRAADYIFSVGSLRNKAAWRSRNTFGPAPLAEPTRPKVLQRNPAAAEAVRVELNRLVDDLFSEIPFGWPFPKRCSISRHHRSTRPNGINSAFRRRRPRPS